MRKNNDGCKNSYKILNFRFLIIPMMLMFIKLITYSYINVYPYRIFLDVQKNQINEEITLYNRTSDELRYKIYLEGVIEDTNIDEVINYYPKTIHLRPGESKNIRVRLVRDKIKEKNEYLAGMVIEQQRVPKRNSKGEFEIVQGVEVYPKIRMPIKIYTGDSKMALKQKNRTIVQNISGREIWLEMFMKISDDKNLKFIEQIRLFKDEEYEITLEEREFQELLFIEKNGGKEILKLKQKDMY